MEQLIAQGLAALGLAPPNQVATQMTRYGTLLLEQNKVMNLTAITDPDQVATLHFLDSAALLGCVDLKGKSLIDVGTGAGFPGMVLRLLEPSLSLTLLDSLDKRLHWLGTVCETLGLVDVTRVHARAEEQSHVPGFRDAFDVATARAVADLRLLCELCLPFVKVGGKFLAMKAERCDGEIAAAIPAVTLLGGRLLEPYRYRVPGTEVDRQVVVIEKIAPTPLGYPRRWAKIQKAPL